MAGETLAFTYLAAGRWLAYLCSLALIGTVSYRFVVLSLVKWQRDGNADWMAAAERRAATVGIAAAGLLAAVQLWRLYAQAYSIFGLDEPVTWSVIRIVVRDTQWGAGWTIQLGVAVFAITVCVAAKVRPRPGWALAVVAAFGVGAALPLTGHAVSQASPVWASVAVQVGHVLGAGVWLGTLFVLAVLGLSGRDADAKQRIRAMVEAFSPVALLGGGILAATGLITAVLYLDAVGDLWGTTYGLTLLLKILLVGSVAGVGAYNWRKVKPTLGEGPNRLKRSAGLELALAGVVLAVTAVLVALALE
jgi:putative copper export protein